MSKQYFLWGLLVVILISCTTNKQPKPKKISSTDDIFAQRTQNSTISPYTTAKAKAYQWTVALDFDLDYITSKKLGDKKHLAELLGIYWKIYKATNDPNFKEEIVAKASPFYEDTKKLKYHNMHVVSNKLFKKNSMSYLRVMWLLQALNFDISAYQKEVKKILPRMNQHLKTRGAWQKEVFKEYYTFFGYKTPSTIKSNVSNNGVIDQKLAFEKYDKANTYMLTHFVFAAFEYGNKTMQNRFDATDMAYLKELLPKLTKTYRETTPNIDLLGELFTCMVYLNITNNPEFNITYKYLLTHQNKNGSWGLYEKHRKRLGKDVDIRAYLHTTLVVLEGLIAFKEEAFAGSEK